MTTPSDRDERDARADQAAERIRLGIELGAGRGLPVRQRFGSQPRLADERTLDALARDLPHRPRDEHGGDEQRQRRRHERGQEEASAERHGRSVSLYPNCLIVSMASVSGGSFSRRRRMWTSTVRVPPV